MDLTQKKCVACEGGISPFTKEQIGIYFKEIENTGWTVIDDKKVIKEFIFTDFKESMVFTNKVATLAEEEGHHPDIYIFYDKVRLEFWTHAIGGLSENDFIMPAKINLFQK